jgi:hypothetical protein
MKRMEITGTLETKTTFGLLPEPAGRIGSFGASVAINLTIAVPLLLALAQVHQVQVQRYHVTTQLAFPTPVVKPWIPQVPRIRIELPR